MLASDAARAFLARILGWSNERAVELAQRSVELALDHRATLTLSGQGDMVALAWGLHRRLLGADRPFVVCDPRRRTAASSVRSAASRASGVSAFEAAVGGSLCLRVHRLPSDFPDLVAKLRAAEDVLSVICIPERADPRLPLVLPVPLLIPPLALRPVDLHRIIEEYALDASSELNAPASTFTDADHAWVREHAATSLMEIEKATLRLVAIRTSANLSNASERLGMALVSLTRWLGRRTLPPAMPSGHRRKQ